MLPGHPIILLKSNEFNMAAVSVKRSIIELLLFGALLPDGWESSSNVSTNNRSFPSSKNLHFGNEETIYFISICGEVSLYGILIIS